MEVPVQVKLKDGLEWIEVKTILLSLHFPRVWQVSEGGLLKQLRRQFQRTRRKLKSQTTKRSKATRAT
jgi:hypothetical protein